MRLGPANRKPVRHGSGVARGAKKTAPSCARRGAFLLGELWSFEALGYEVAAFAFAHVGSGLPVSRYVLRLESTRGQPWRIPVSMDEPGTS